MGTAQRLYAAPMALLAVVDDLASNDVEDMEFNFIRICTE